MIPTGKNTGVGSEVTYLASRLLFLMWVLISAAHLGDQRKVLALIHCVQRETTVLDPALLGFVEVL